MGLMSFILDAYENSRKTKTNVKPDKTRSKKYDFDAGITGDKKLDCPKVEVPKVKKSKGSKGAMSKGEREDR